MSTLIERALSHRERVVEDRVRAGKRSITHDCPHPPSLALSRRERAVHTLKCILMLILTFALCSCSSRPAAAVASPADNKLNGGYRFERNGWIYVHLQGSPDRLGYQHGYLLADEVRELLRVVGPFLEHTTHKD